MVALRLANQFLEIAQQAGRDYITYSFTALQNVIGLVVEIFARHSDMAAAEALLQLIDVNIPFLATVSQGYCTFLHSYSIQYTAEDTSFCTPPAHQQPPPYTNF